MGQDLGDLSLSVSGGVPSLLRVHPHPVCPVLDLVPIPWPCCIIDATPQTSAQALRGRNNTDAEDELVCSQ